MNIFYPFYFYRNICSTNYKDIQYYILECWHDQFKKNKNKKLYLQRKNIVNKTVPFFIKISKKYLL